MCCVSLCVCTELLEVTKQLTCVKCTKVHWSYINVDTHCTIVVPMNYSVCTLVYAPYTVVNFVRSAYPDVIKEGMKIGTCMVTSSHSIVMLYLIVCDSLLLYVHMEILCTCPCTHWLRRCTITDESTQTVCMYLHVHVLILS